MKKKDYTQKNAKFIREYKPKHDGSLADGFMLNCKKFNFTSEKEKQEPTDEQ